MPRPTYAEVDLDAIRHNYHVMRSRLGVGVKLLGIVKADAYGHGAAPVARTLEEVGADMFGVALVEEGIELRAAGIQKPILIMGLLPPEEVPAAIEHRLAATIDDLATALELETQAARCHGRLHVHLKIDTGMNRLGVRAEEAPQAFAAVSRLQHLAIDGAYTHFACADGEDDGVSEQQLARLSAALAGMRSAGASVPLVHSANSAAILSIREAHFGMVRSGLALYGVRPCAAASDAGLRPALSLHSRVVHLKRVRRGEGVSYGHTWRAARDSVLGLVPIGYADGYRRALSNRGQVRIAGRLCPVVGVVCMDATLVDLTDLVAPSVGQPATLIEADNSSPISADAIARLCQTIPYEILTGIGRRVPRIYCHESPVPETPEARSRVKGA